MVFLELLLFLGACVGNAAILVFLLNRTYALPLPHKVLHLLRAVYGLLILSGPIVLWRMAGFRPMAFLGEQARSLAENYCMLYLVCCWAVGFVLLPAATIVRHARRKPAALKDGPSRTIDIAGCLGYKPAGNGKYRLLTRLPGNEAFQVEFAEKTLELPNLPPVWDGMSILHLSDLHLCGSPDRIFYEQVMDVCRDWEPDLVAITGDIVDSPNHHRWVIPVLSRLRWREAAFAILGNHDSWYKPDRARRRLAKLGIQVLGNRWRQVTIRGEPLVVVGNETPWFRPRPDFTYCPRGTFRLCLSHTPDHFAWARQHKMDLVLAGHVHGGQIRLPVVGSVFVPSAYGRRYDCGTFHEGETIMHVSRGLGGQQPLRYRCPPEVSLLTLRALPRSNAARTLQTNRADAVAS